MAENRVQTAHCIRIQPQQPPHDSFVPLRRSTLNEVAHKARLQNSLRMLIQVIWLVCHYIYIYYRKTFVCF
jgi:hypothetical protein